MFEPYLSCRPFSLAHGSRHADVARAWMSGGAIEQAEFGSVWNSEAQVNVAGCAWYASQGAMTLKARNAIVRVGTIADKDIFFFISPFRSVAAAFQDSARSDIPRQIERAVLTEFSVNLKALLADDRTAPLINSCEYISSRGDRVTAQHLRKHDLEHIATLHSISLAIAEVCIKVNSAMELEVDALDAPVEALASGLAAVFLTIGPHATLSR